MTAGQDRRRLHTLAPCGGLERLLEAAAPRPCRLLAVDRLSAPAAIGAMTREQFDTELQKGMDDIAAGRVIDADTVEAEMRNMYGV